MFDRLKKVLPIIRNKVARPPEQKAYRQLGDIPVERGSFLEFALGMSLDMYGFSYLNNYRAMRFYRQSTSVATAVDAIADEIENINMVISTEDGKLSSDHEILRMLKNPNDYEMYQDFIGQSARSYLITGDTYWFAGGALNRPPVVLYCEKPHNVNTIEGMNGYTHTFNVYRGVGTGTFEQERTPKMGVRYYDGNLRELFNIRRYSSRYSTTHGDSPLLAAALEVAQQVLNRFHNVSVLENGGKLSLVVQFKDTISPDEHEERKRKIQEQLSGSSNAGRIAVISSNDMEIEEFGKTNRDMDFYNLDIVARNAIYNRYKVPLPLISMEASTFNNMELAVYHFYDFAVIPLFNRLASGLTKFLFPRYGLDPNRLCLTYNPENIEALKSRRISQLRKRKELGVETINEIREGLPNREPLEGGDTLYQAANLVPVGTDLFIEDNTTTEEEAQRLANATKPQTTTEEEETEI